MESSWLWNVNKTEAEAKRILKDPSDERFIHFAALLLSRRRGLPKEIFQEYLRKEDFCRYWAAIKRKMRKDNWNDQRIPFWDEIYKLLIRKFGEEGVTFPKEKKPAVRDPAREKAGREVRERRRAHKMTQAELAKKMGVSQQFVAKVESGTQNLSVSTLEKIRKALQIKPVEYSVEEPFREGRVTEPVTTWFTREKSLETFSK